MVDVFLAFLAYKAYRARVYPDAGFVPEYVVFCRMIANNPEILEVYRKEGII